MKLYQIISPHHEFEDGSQATEHTVVWTGTQSDARKIRIEFEKNFKDIKPAKRPRVLVEEVDVPTSKAELILWLNQNTA